MAKSAGSLLFELSANVAKLRTDMQQANKVMTDALAGIKRAAGAIGITIGAAMAVNLAKGFADSIVGAIDQADALGKLAERFGTTAESMSVLQYQAKTSNVSVDALTTSIRFLSKAMVDAQNPASTQAQAFRAIGLSVDDLKSKDPAAAMADIAEAMSGFADGANKVAVARAIFGRTGDELIPMLNQGRQGFADAKAEAEALGIVISSQTAKAAAEFTTNMTRLKAITDATKQTIAAAMLPALQGLVEWFVEGIKEGNNLKGVFAFIAEQAILTAADIMSLTGHIKIQASVFVEWARAAKQALGGDFKGAMDTIKTSNESTRASLGRLNTEIESFKKNARAKVETGMAGVGAEAQKAIKPVIDFNGAVEKAGKAGRVAKAGVDEYAQMLASLQEELRRTVANGDAMQLLLTDPKFLSKTAEQRDVLQSYTEQIIKAKEANEAEAKAQRDAAESRKIAEDANIATTESLRNLADSTLNAIDPTREYADIHERLAAAYYTGFLNLEQYSQAQDYWNQKIADMKKPLGEARQSLQDVSTAVTNFAQSTASTFVDFVTGADNAASSFADMAASILRDLAKLVVQVTIMEPLMRNIKNWFSADSGGGGFNIISAIGGFLGFGGGRAAGGLVQPGTMYRVNESPFSSEFFLPTSTGRVVPDRGQAVNVAITVNATTGATTEEANTATGIELAKRMSAVARQVIADEKRAGGLLAQGA
ncbi:hypothetical protein QF001_003771 [Paraburkholderia youngii]|uniref:phage tail tape measure C-terminal domain-containing protein n=1 Tax=Paraburkholderia youngii TaxID=2782701 RepID=UPI003D255624